jgi:hypothetical protein
LRRRSRSLLRQGEVDASRFARGEAFDEQAMPELDSEAIGLRVASESFSEHRKLKRPDLAQCFVS